jgi:Tfp pilus assembly protein PilN
VRAVNLIPPDERRGDKAALRTGLVPYLVVGVLAVAVLAAVVLALTSKQISDRKSEVAQLQQQEQQAQAHAQSLEAFTQFRAAQEARSATIVSLAQSRFDWRRVLEEFSRVIPPNVWFVKIAGTVDPTVSVPDGPDLQERDSVPGPALEMEGCAASQDDVARLIANLEEVDGVTRVGLESSELPDDSQAGGATASPTTGDSGAEGNVECRTRPFIPKFKIIAAFDAVPTPATATSAPSVPAGVPTSSGSQLTSQSASSSTTGG